MLIPGVVVVVGVVDCSLVVDIVVVVVGVVVTVVVGALDVEHKPHSVGQ